MADVADNGELLADRYQLIEPIGRGGVAEVWRAEDVSLGRPVAVKLWTAYGSDTVWQQARDAVQLVHPNVARLYDIAAYGDRLFVVMELVTGRDLATILAERGPLPVVQVAEIGTQAARVLAAAHAMDIVHRGVKPGNLLVSSDGTVKVTDFGTTAAAADGPAGDASASGRTAETAAYVSPEQAVGLPAGPASDLYGLGCVLYELLVGRPPFTHEGDDPEPVLRQHVEDNPEPPGRLRPDIPAELEHAVLRLLAKNPADRPGSADRIAEVLNAIAALQSISDP